MNPSGIDTNGPLAHRSLGSRRLIHLQRYALAILSVGIALGASLLLEHFHFRPPAAPLLLFAVAVSSWYGGTGPAVLAVILSMISFFWYFVVPVRTMYIYPSDVPYLICFAVFAALMSWFRTVRRRVEKDLRDQADLLNLTHDTIFVMDREGVIKYWNRGAENRYGWSTEQAVGRVVHDLLKTVFPAPLKQIRAELTRTGHWEGELLHTKKDGTQVVVASRWSLQRNERGAPLAILETNNDITERKRAEEALRDNETLFRTFVDHAADAFFMLEFEQGTIIDCNQCACESLGLTRQELIGLTPLAFDVNLDRETLKSVADRTVAGETVLFDRHWHHRKDGSLFPVEVHTSMFWHGGRRFLLKVARDISERLCAEEERERLRELEADLAHINRVSMLGELVASIAHEVNQPLSGVVSNGSACLRWLAGDAPNVEEAREAARHIIRDGKRAAEVVTRIRALTKRTAAVREKLNLNETIREVLALVGDEPRRKSVIIRTQFADDLSPVSGDRVQLQQVVLNLVMNAVEAMSSVGERPRELVIATRNIDADQMRVTVEDSGIGLDPSTMGKIFDPFYTTKPGGMGMGLSISRSILETHGGRLWATVKNGPGAMFHFTPPKYHEEESHAGATGA